MPVIKTVGDLAKGAVGTALSAARHPVSTAAVTAGFVKGAAESGVGLVRSTISGRVPQPRTETTTPTPAVTPDEAPSPEPEAVEGQAIDEPEAIEEEPEAIIEEPELPGPDIVLREVPTADELPEPIVIEATEPPNEAIQHEPHATTRSDTIGHEAADRLEAQDEADEALEEISHPQA